MSRYFAPNSRSFPERAVIPHPRSLSPPKIGPRQTSPPPTTPHDQTTIKEEDDCRQTAILVRVLPPETAIKEGECFHQTAILVRVLPRRSQSKASFWLCVRGQGSAVRDGTLAAMNGIVTKWVESQEYEVVAADRDDAGAVRDETVARWVDAARLSYLDRCPELQRLQRESGAELRHRAGTLPAGAALGNATHVAVSSTAAEVRPQSFTLSLRLRPLGGDQERPLDTTCVIRLEDPATGEGVELGKEIRDELIALEHSAGHYN